MEFIPVLFLFHLVIVIILGLEEFVFFSSLLRQMGWPSTLDMLEQSEPDMLHFMNLSTRCHVELLGSSHGGCW